MEKTNSRKYVTIWTTFTQLSNSPLNTPQLLLDFLDTSIHLGEHGKLFSNVYSKPTDTFPLLDSSSQTIQ